MVLEHNLLKKGKSMGVDITFKNDFYFLFGPEKVKSYFSLKLPKTQGRANSLSFEFQNVLIQEL